MSLSELWQTSRYQLSGKRVSQIISFAGDGKLRDGNDTSREFRGFLSQVAAKDISEYVDECLNNSFPESGLALQDIINQVGQRLGFDVQDGLYQGSRTAIGFDGLWRFPDGHNVVVEVKTIDTDRIAGYRRRLIADGRIGEERSSILIVVGRSDTGDLEAQIRGSRHAWDIRLISIDALLRLMKLKEEVGNPKIIEQICAVLIPKEFTKLDEIIDIVFLAAEEVKQEAEITEEESEEMLSVTSVAGDTVQPVAFHDACIHRFASRNALTLVKRTKTSYTSPDNGTAVVCAVSKTYSRQGHSSYWFAFHPYQKEFLERVPNSYLILGCGSQEAVLAIPFAKVRAWLDDLWMTERDDRMYWHIRLHNVGGEILLDRKKGKGQLKVTSYMLS